MKDNGMRATKMEKGSIIGKMGSRIRGSGRTIK